MGNLAPAIMPNAYIFICTEAGGKWSAKQTNDEKALSAEVEGDRAALEVELTKVVKEACGGSAFTINHSQITPTTTPSLSLSQSPSQRRRTWTLISSTNPASSLGSMHRWYNTSLPLTSRGRRPRRVGATRGLTGRLSDATTVWH